MRFVIQSVSEADVTVEENVVGKIGTGFLVLVGIGEGDTEEVARAMVKKMLGLRIFADENGKTNRSLSDVQGALLLVSQFTLYADCRKGNRPSFIHAGEPGKAKALYEFIAEECRGAGFPVQTGIFGAYMKVRLVNEGPFTIILDSRELGLDTK